MSRKFQHLIRDLPNTAFYHGIIAIVQKMMNESQSRYRIIKRYRHQKTFNYWTDESGKKQKIRLNELTKDNSSHFSIYLTERDSPPSMSEKCPKCNYRMRYNFYHDAWICQNREGDFNNWCSFSITQKVKRKRELKVLKKVKAQKLNCPTCNTVLVEGYSSPVCPIERWDHRTGINILNPEFD